MAKLTFQTLSFQDKGKTVQVNLLKNFYTCIPKEEFDRIGKFQVIDAHTIEFSKIIQEKAENRFSFLLDKYFPTLKTKITGNFATYIHQNSEIPLIGNVAFGIVYRNSSIVEIKPVTSCNLDCVYCSISEGLSSKKHDFVVEEDYLIAEFKKLLKFIDEPIEAHIGVQGEPFLYAQMEELFSNLEQIEQVHTISIDTNGSLLNEEKIHKLSKFKKLQLNLSLDAIDNETAKKLAGTKTYNVKHVLKNIALATQIMPRTPIVAPVFTPGFNDDEMEKIVLWVKNLKKQPILGIQNFLKYKTGRSTGKELTWDKFYEMIDNLEKKHSIKLKLSKEDFHIKVTKPLPKPFVVDDVIPAVIKCPDRFKGSVIAIARGRNISVPNCEYKKNKKIVVKIIRDKHNIFSGTLI